MNVIAAGARSEETRRGRRNWNQKYFNASHWGI